MNDTPGNEDTLEPQEEADLELDLESEDDADESVESLKEKLAKTNAELAKKQELADNYKIRAEKAETRAKEHGDKPKPKTESKQELSTDDLYDLLNAKVPREDFEEVRDYAKLKKISIGEALKHPTIKAILKDNAENRSVAEAAHTGTTRRSNPKLTDDNILDKASEGEMPEDVESLVSARLRKRGAKV